MSYEVVVIGAGPAGLAAAAAVRRAKLDVLVLDRADAIGASWRNRYDRLRLNTSRLTSKLPHGRYARGTPLFPGRDEVVRYLEGDAEQNALEIRLRTRVERIDRENGGWALRASAGDVSANNVIVATGYEHTPTIPDWPGRESFQGQLLHAAEYRNAAPFRDEDVLVVGPGCSGVEIAYDLAEHGARRVRLAVRTPPTIVLRLDRGVPGDVPAILMMRAPIRFADAQLLKVSRKATGDLSAYGLAPPEKGPMTRLKEEGKAPAIVDKEMIEAIRQRKIEIVTSVETLDGTGVTLANGDRIEPDAIIAATGYRCGLEPLVGHLGVLDGRGVPLVVGGGEAAPGLRFVGYVPRPGQIRFMGHEARRVASEIRRS